MSENTISNIKIGETTYLINDTTKASIENVVELNNIVNENNNLLGFANSKLDELLLKIGSSNHSNVSNNINFYQCTFLTMVAQYLLITILL